MVTLTLAPVLALQMFGSPDYPLRPSAIDDLMRCSGKLALNWLPEPRGADSLGGPAAQTGNLVHAGVAAFHKSGNDVEVGRVAIAESSSKFPGGDEKTATKHYDAYIADPQNQIAVPYTELPVTGIFAPLPDDPLGLPIVINGTTDQIRLHEDGQLYIWDIKTGSRMKTRQYLFHHMYQLSTYAILATQTLGKQVNPGGVIGTNGYLAGERAIVHCPWYYETSLHHMYSVLRAVTEIRKGNIQVNPSKESCEYCPLRNIETCLPKQSRITDVRYKND